MAKKTTNKSKINNKKYKSLGVVASVLIILFAVGFCGYYLGSHKDESSKTPTENVPGYIAEDSARGQVENFYKQYLNPKRESPEESRDITVKGFGSDGLEFYRQYYRHGFDPIVCSETMPTSITVTSAEPGPGAIVHAEAKYSDGSIGDIVLTLSLNVDGFNIDTITCPGDKGNLPPAS